MPVYEQALKQELSELKEALLNMGFSDVYFDSYLDTDDVEELEEYEKIHVQVRFNWSKKKDKNIFVDGRKDFSGNSKKSIIAKAKKWLQDNKNDPDSYFYIILK
ncbi:hypothetical protein AAGG74_17175 [Bacillus mexicanus]|uniref:hypothetical protein n=1 Tax=Bacillus mexicanus TaxID=2834415 RepID=UPI003D192B8B